MYNFRYEYFFFTDMLNDEMKKKIINFNKINIIFYNSDDNKTDKLNIDKYKLIYKFCKKNRIPIYLTNNERYLLKLKAHGIFLTSKNRNTVYSKIANKILIGSAHNQIEYYFKERQGCKLVMLSPLFFNKKYSTNKILNPIKFNLIAKNWKIGIGALGGINFSNLNKIRLLRNLTSIGFITWLKK